MMKEQRVHMFTLRSLSQFSDARLSLCCLCCICDIDHRVSSWLIIPALPLT
jgi:hypothetical protein